MEQSTRPSEEKGWNNAVLYRLPTTQLRTAWDESEESRSGSTRDRPGRGGRRAAGPSTPPHRPPPPSISQRRSPRLTTSAVRDLRSLPLASKSDRRTAHSRSVSGDEQGRGPSRSSPPPQPTSSAGAGRGRSPPPPLSPQPRGLTSGPD